MRQAYEAPDIDVTTAQRQAGDNSVQIANFVSSRTAIGTADASFSFGNRALRPSSGLTGDRYLETDIGTLGGWLYYWTGTAWEWAAGWASGTDAARAAITVNATDNGAWFYTTDTKKFWQVSGGSWVDRTPPAPASTQITETGGPTTLDIGAIDDGEFLVRSGTDIISSPMTAPALDVVTATSDMTTTDANDVVLVDTTLGSVVRITLHDPTTAKQKPYVFKLILTAGLKMIVDGDGFDIDGVPTQETNVQYVSFSLVPDNASSLWWVV